MSEIGIKLMIILAAIAVAIGAKFIPYQQESRLVEKAAEEVIEQEF